MPSMEPAYSKTGALYPTMMDPESSKELPEPWKKFYRGEPLALGITQILLGILGIMLGSMQHLSYEEVFRFPYNAFMAPYWTGMAFLVSGFLSVAAARKPNLSLVKSIMGMNVVCAIVAGLGIAFLSISLAHGQRDLKHQCEIGISSKGNRKCYAYKIIYGIMGIQLIFNVLEFCISLYSAVFGCKTLCRDNFTDTVVMVYQNAPPVSDAYPPVYLQDVPSDHAVSLPAASEDAENLLSRFLASPPGLLPLTQTSEAQGVDEGILHQHESVDQADSDEVDSKM